MHVRRSDVGAVVYVVLDADYRCFEPGLVSFVVWAMCLESDGAAVELYRPGSLCVFEVASAFDRQSRDL